MFLRLNELIATWDNYNVLKRKCTGYVTQALGVNPRHVQSVTLLRPMDDGGGIEVHPDIIMPPDLYFAGGLPLLTMRNGSVHLIANLSIREVLDGLEEAARDERQTR